MLVLTVASKAAMRFRDWPPMFVKDPPAYTVVPLITKVETVPFALGLQAVAMLALMVASNAASRLRDWPPMFVKDPPA